MCKLGVHLKLSGHLFMSTLETQETTVSVVPIRKRYSLDFKRELIKASNESGQSIAKVAQHHGINPNLLHKWRRQFRAKETASKSGEVRSRSAGNDFVRLTPAALPSGTDSETVRIELPGGIVVHWPLSRMSESVDWLKAFVR